MLKYIILAIVGMIGGLVVGLGILFIGDSISPVPARIADYIETPVRVLCQLISPTSEDTNAQVGSIKWFMLFHFIYWAVLGGILCMSTYALFRKITRNE
jgi:hypothetical protein